MSIPTMKAKPKSALKYQPRSKQFNGYKRATAHTLYMNTSPTQWANGLAIGNGQYGGLLFQPDNTILEYAFTRLDLWKRHLVGPSRLPLDKFKELLSEGVDKLQDEINKEFFDTERPSFKPGGRLKINIDAWGLSHSPTLFDKNMKMEIAHGEVAGSYEISSKAMKWTALATSDDDVTAIHLCDTYRNYLCRFNYTQRVELYRLPDPQARIIRSGITDDGIAYLEFDFNEELKALTAFTIDGLPWAPATDCMQGQVAINVSLNYELSALSQLQSSLQADSDPFNNTPPPKLQYDIFHTLIVDTDGSKGDLLAIARKKLFAAKKQGFDNLQQKTRKFWHTFWNKCGITLENPALEGLWYCNLYHIAATSRGQVMPGLFGLWNAEATPPWNGDYHGNINVAMYVWPLFALNHPELHKCVFNTLESWFPNMRKQTKEAFGVDELRFPQATGPEGREMSRGHYRTMRCSTGFYADHYIKWHQYDPDPERLRNHILPILESAARYYFIYCNEKKDGKLWIGPSWAPEQGVFPAWNTGNDLALFKELFQAVVAFNKELGQWSETAQKAQELLDIFPDYPQVNGEFIGSGSETGRTLLCHPSYLANVVPAEDIDADSPLAGIARKTMRKHLDHTYRKTFRGQFGVACDLTAHWLLTVAIKLRDAEFAQKLLEDCILQNYVKSNGMYCYIGNDCFHTQICKRKKYDVPDGQSHALLGQTSTLAGRAATMSMVQNEGAMLYAINESMLQSQGNQLKFFPVYMKICGQKQSFHNLSAVGGLTVSAARNNYGLHWLHITAGKYAWSGTIRVFDKCDIPLKKVGKNTYALSLKPGEEFVWKRPSAGFERPATPQPKPGIRSYNKKCPVQYGIKAAFFDKQ